jgi:hypothetical protein
MTYDGGNNNLDAFLVKLQFKSQYYNNTHFDLSKS